MSEISDLEGRISAAMERIGRGVETLHSAATQPGVADDVQALRRALENEAMVTAQMEERVRALSGQQSDMEAELEAQKAAHSETEAALIKADAALAIAQAAQVSAEEALEEASAAAATVNSAGSDENIAANREAMEQMGQRLRRLRKLNKVVRENNEKLRVAASDGVADPALINDSLQIELDSLNALRDAELSETDLILSGLRPMLAGQAKPDAQVDGTSQSMGEE